MRPREIGCEHGRPEAVGGLVGHADGVLLRGEARDDHERTKNLLLIDTHLVGDIREDGGLDKVALAGGVAERLTTGHELCALTLSNLDVGHDTFVLRFSDLRTLEGRLVEGVPDLRDTVHLRLERSQKFVVDLVLHEDARRRGADLALIRHDT